MVMIDMYYNNNCTFLLIQKPEDVPIPGGTVYIRQKPCKYPPGTSVNPSHHQHIRRFMIPKDAATIASKSMAMIESAQATQNGYQNGTNGNISSNKGQIRPHSAIGSMQRGGPSARRPKTAAQRSRIKSAFN